MSRAIREAIITAYALAAIIEAAWRRLELTFRHPAASGRHPTGCPFCGHQLGSPYQRPARDVRGPKGQIKRIPGELLTWRVCGGCTRHQVGERVTEVAW